MITKKVITVVLMVLVLIFTALVALVVFYPPVKKPPVVAVPSAGLTDQEIMESTGALIKAGDLNGCDLVDKIVSGVNYRIVCRNNILEDQAKKNMDFSACDKLTTTSAAIDICKINTIGAILKNKGDISACGTVPESLKQTCHNIYWSNLAFEQKNPKPCENLSSSSAIYLCQSNVMDLLFKTGNKVDCSLFSNKTLKTQCQAGGE